MGKLFILLEIHVILRRRGQRRRWVGGGGVKGMITHQLQKFTPTWARISSDHNVFYTLGEGGQRQGPMPLGLFLFFWCHLPQTSARSKNT